MKTLLPIILVLASLKGIAQCTDPVFSFTENFTNTLNDPPECWSEINSSQTAYNTGAMRILGAHNGDPEAMVITRKLFNVRGVLSFTIQKGQSFFDLPGDGIGVGVINGDGHYINLFDITYEANPTTYNLDFSDYNGTGDQIAFARTGVNKKVASIDNISYTSLCEAGVSAIAKDIIISLDADGNATLTATEVDNGSMDICGNAASLSIDVSSFTCDDLGQNTVTLTAEDTFGTTETATSTVTVEPYIDVVLKSDEIAVELDNTGNVSITTSDLVDGSNTTCGTISLALDQSDFSCAEIGDVTVMITATHSTGPDKVFEKLISIVDDVPPVVNANASVNLALDATTFTAELTTAMVDNGSTDNCGIDTQVLSKTIFSCNDLGDNQVTYTIADVYGNEVETSVTVNVTSVIADETVTTTETTTYCPSGTNAGGIISTGGSVAGIDYYLRDSKDNSVVDGPIAGTGSGLDFTTGTIDGSKTFNVFAKKSGESQALSFDGINDYVDIGSDAREINKEVTVSAWIKTSSTNPNNISGKYNGVNGFFMYINANGTVGFDGRDGTGVYKASGASTSTVNDGNWHMITGSANLTTGQWKVYVDGVLESTTTNAAGNTLVTTEPMRIGSLWSFSSAWFTGEIDQLAVFNTELSAEDIEVMNSECLNGDETNLVGLYRLDEGSGTSVEDLSSQGIAGTLTNMDESTDWVSGSLACEVLCSFQMSTEITFGDSESPQLVAQNVTLQLDSNGEGSIAATDVDNGTTDNCTSAGNLTLSLSKSTFGCTDVGENIVEFTVTDESGNASSSDITVTVVSPITDQIPSAATSGFCAGESTTISIPASQSKIEYYLRKSSDNSVVDGPITGTGNALDFNTGALTETTEFNVMAKFGGGPGSSLGFDGSNDYVDTDVEIPATSAMTIEAWIYPLGGLTNTIMTNSIHAGTGSTNLELGEFWFNTASNTGGNGLTFTYIASNGVAATHSRTNILTFNEWNHVAVSFDGATGSATMWINGVELTTATTAGASTQMGRTGSTIGIGKRHGGSGSKFFSGRIDEVRVWNSIRTTQEINDYKDMCLVGNEVGLIGYFDFEEGTGGSIADQVASGTGTLTNFDTNVAWVDGAVGCVEVCEVQMATEVTVEVIDAPPVVSAKDITIQLDANGSVTITPLHVEDGSTDDCAAQSEDLEFALSQTTFTCADIGANVLTFTVTDGAGNESTASVTVTVEDSPPVISANDVTLNLDASGTATLTAEQVNNGTVDDCSTVITYVLSQTDFTCAHLGDNEVTFTATDESGNTSTQTVNVSVIDDIDPQAISFLIVDLELDALGNAILDPSVVDAGAMDNCSSGDGLTLGVSESEFTCSDIGANSVVFTAEDESGNIGTSNITVNVLDNLAPTAIAQNIEVRLTQTNTVEVTNLEVDNGSSDNCGSVTLSLEKVQDPGLPAITSKTSTASSSITFSESDLGTNDVRLTVTDESGNSSETTATVTVLEYKLSQTITVEPLSDKVYGNESFEIEASASSSLAVNYSVVSGPIQLSGEANNVVSITGTGTAVIRISQEGNDEYQAATSVDESFTISQAALTITADNKSMVYGMAIPELTFSYDGFEYEDDASAMVAEPTISTDAISTNNVGVYQITLEGGVADNYEITLIDGDLTINKANQTITFDPIEDKASDDLPFTINVSVDSGLPLDFSIAGPATLNGSTVTLDGTDGTVTITASNTGDQNHNEVSVSESFEVTTVLSVEDDLANSVKVYPNPFANHLSIEHESPVDVIIYSMNGQAVIIRNNHLGMFDVSELGFGFYLLKVSDGNTTVTQKILKRN